MDLLASANTGTYESDQLVAGSIDSLGLDEELTDAMLTGLDLKKAAPEDENVHEPQAKRARLTNLCADYREAIAILIISLCPNVRLGLLLGYNDLQHPTTPTAPYRLVDALPPNLQFLRHYGYKKEQIPEMNAQVTELLEKKAERFPGLVDGIEGVDELNPDTPGTYTDSPNDEDDLWERPTKGYKWAMVGDSEKEEEDSEEEDSEDRVMELLVQNFAELWHERADEAEADTYNDHKTETEPCPSLTK
ncbi:hypothetical protein B0T17DRAFT_621089 [Bombardia bombarda]|uniref:Uncharacterized protein n=1 Tax=Bombardia bombarda TaxID=252184 RepID=A0AA39TRU4_9PEZI|nr:hypothetical protein B0T17DRAFT_621089 [Bombardia bombarda]